jgi:hypothetical protein
MQKSSATVESILKHPGAASNASNHLLVLINVSTGQGARSGDFNSASEISAGATNVSKYRLDVTIVSTHIRQTA